jgi:Fe2+ or Zn2+ uptake regulation protein
MTKNQEIILKIIQSADRHLTAEDIYMKCRNKTSKMSIATVYRNLSVMVDKDMIARISTSGLPDHYDKNIVRHEHIICRYCGNMQDVDVGDLKSYLEQYTGMEISSYDLCMRYVCDSCKQKQKKA